MKKIYDFSLLTFTVLLRLFGGSSSRLKELVEGRKSVFLSLKNFRDNNNQEVVWFHAASLGEYEQAKPVILELKKLFPDYAVVLTFFSPSGYKNVIKKKPPYLDFITYLPFDTAANAEKFVDLLNPKMAFFVKYDLWANFILVLKKKNVPLFLFSASLRKGQIYFKPYGRFFRKVLKSFDYIFTQNQVTLDLLKSINYHTAALTGDTRYDNVRAISQYPTSYPDIEDFIKAGSVIVIGSAWEEDMDLIIPFINGNPRYKFIIAPHAVEEKTIAVWQDRISLPSIKYSQLGAREIKEEKVLFIDNIGMLSSLYQYAKMAYVGGAFGKGLHNILEPLTFGIPVIFGQLKKMGKFPEAAISRTYGCGFEVGDLDGLLQVVLHLEKEQNYQSACKAADKLIEDNLGSAKKIMLHVQKNLQMI
jgi:3-deoxy-D-manno-octulosonic-acid transferase